MKICQIYLGKTEFSPEEDPHVVGDCVKVLYCVSTMISSFIYCVEIFVSCYSICTLQHVLRQLPSSPVPASCCTALLEAYSKSLYR